MLKSVNINLHIIILWSILCLASCSNSEPGNILITGAFGLFFGDKADEVGEAFLSELKRIEVANPPAPDVRFKKYFNTVTPGSHRIYQISAATDASLNKPGCDAMLDDLAQELTQKYYRTGEAIINDADDKWVLQRNTKRSVSLECMTAPSAPGPEGIQLYRLSLSYLDYNLATEAYKEWKKKPLGTENTDRTSDAY